MTPPPGIIFPQEAYFFSAFPPLAEGVALELTSAFDFEGGSIEALGPTVGITGPSPLPPVRVSADLGPQGSSSCNSGNVSGDGAHMGSSEEGVVCTTVDGVG